MQIETASAAIRRTLLSLVQTPHAAASRLVHEPHQLILMQGDSVLDSLALPARPSAIARFLNRSSRADLQNGWQFDATRRQLLNETEAHTLTEKEALLLDQLLSNFPNPSSRESLLKNIWGMQADIDTHTLETHIYRLRHKLAELHPKPCDIVTTDSAYRISMEPA